MLGTVLGGILAVLMAPVVVLGMAIEWILGRRDPNEDTW